MGLCPIFRMRRNEKGEYKMIMQKMKILQQEISMVMSEREDENNAYQREVLAFTFKEAEWQKERKKLREEVKRLQRKDSLCQVVDKARRNERDDQDDLRQCCVEKMRQERARRDEAEEEFMEEIHKEINAKDETIEALRARVASMEEEEYKRKREVDILRQSLRIMCNKKKKKKATKSKYGC
ncbi:hypothetical protein V2J09_014346 [Rumex salicifolius]